jgi:hypothetical protein
MTLSRRSYLETGQRRMPARWAVSKLDQRGGAIMNKACILILITVICLLFIGGSALYAAATYDSSNHSAAGRKVQSVPSGHLPGKDNGPGEGTHNAGEECGACHRLNGKAGNYLFTASGTLYEDRAARKPLRGGEVILQDRDGKIISMTSNAAGNFWTYAPIASNPCSVASHGDTTHELYTLDPHGNCIPLDPTGSDTRTWQYKAWVKHNGHVRPMVTIAPVGGATDGASRMSCNMHHAGLGSRGGLWASGKSTLSSYPPEGLSFKRHILPIFRNKCAPCHIPGATLTRLVTASDLASPSTSMDFSKGLDLTSYAGSSVSSKGVTITKRGVKDVTAAYQANPDSSPALAMTLSEDVHPGGRFWTKEDPDYIAIRRWIAEGAKDN